MTRPEDEARRVLLTSSEQMIKLKTNQYMILIALFAVVLVVGMALAELEGAMIAFGICGFVALLVFLAYR